MLQSDESNQVKEMMLNKVVFLNSNTFWSDLKTIFENGYRIRDPQIENISETNPTDISEKDLIYNLARFGYREFGSTIVKGNNISIEYIIISILMIGNARRIDAIAILIAKNIGGINTELLGFLSRKYNVLNKLLKLLDTSDLKHMSELKEKFDLYKV